ncbi:MULTISPECIES: hypothetical protein [unclassified Pseudoalteromonas]|uniref:hypothetical protein n=1 Tax=unclassified Pseudoalteromonas TaxID=194690 RepID=UPI001E3BCF89|nr:MULTISPECIES: hypothetical protein [unclassified Pseudoalteromonas]
MMQTNTKSSQPKQSNWVLTPEIMILSIALVAVLIIGITALRDTNVAQPVINMQPVTFLQDDTDNTQIANNTFDSQNTSYAQNETVRTNDKHSNIRSN